MKFIISCFKVPGELNISYELLGPENRTLAGVIQQSSDELNLITGNVDIVVFTNVTQYNLTWVQLDDTDVVDNYYITAEVSLKIDIATLTVCMYLFVCTYHELRNFIVLMNIMSLCS